MRVLVLNNYSFDRVFEEIDKGLKPAHHLYGVDFLKQSGYEVNTLPLNENRKTLNRINSKIAATLEYFFGDMEQQRACLKQLHKDDIIFAPCQTQTSYLSYLRYLGIIKNKIVVLAHHPPVKGKFSAIKKIFFKAELKGVSSFPALSYKVAEYINSLIAKPKSPILTWGPDIPYYDKYILANNPNELGFFCAGRTGRDYETLIKGAEIADTSLSVFYLSKTDQFSSNNHNIRIKRLDKELELSYNIALPIIARSRAVCIPFLDDPNSLAGLTSLTDAIGMGKPVIMTRNQFINIDIEKEGIGIWAESANPGSWHRAINLLSDDKVYNEMSKNSLKLRNEFFNYGTYCTELKTIFDKLRSE